MSVGERILSINAIDEIEDEVSDEAEVLLTNPGGCPDEVEEELDEQALLIGATFVSDAIYGRLEEHRTDMASLRYTSSSSALLLFSSFVSTSPTRWPPCWWWTPVQAVSSLQAPVGAAVVEDIHLCGPAPGLHRAALHHHASLWRGM
jgi:hypothetical protein